MANVKNKGFSLVELSIVLIIVGLLIGSVLVGQELINSAKILSASSQFAKYNSAIAVFRSKYKGMAGDFERAIEDLGSTANGDGNGVIAENASLVVSPLTAGNATDYSIESLFFWDHLAKATLLEIAAVGSEDSVKLGTTHPRSMVGSGGVLAYSDSGESGSYFFLGILSSSNISFYSSLENTVTPTEASRLDVKLDNGIATSGYIQSRNADIDAPGDTTATTGCNDANGNYYMSNVAKACSLRLRIIPNKI